MIYNAAGIPPAHHAIINDSRTLTTLQSLVDRALAGAIAGQFFDLDDLPNFRNLTGDETAQNPGGVRALGGNDTLNGGSTAALLDVLRGG
ncbi:MAG TPA: hypothetical protein DCQ32_05460 [Cyanobacteria bacterium UBA8156]|nr:hypothetical protein [Cyanobacteria bacterium UBA8156]